MTTLGVNIDHVATVRQARRGQAPDPVDAALAAIAGGADGITAHLREDRRHIKDEDIRQLRSRISVPLNLEMALVPDIVALAVAVGPAWACLVPEKRMELTTEGGLDVAQFSAKIKQTVAELGKASVKVSLFIEPELSSVEQAASLGASAVELHTGIYARACESENKTEMKSELDRITRAAERARALGLRAHAGHGLSYENVVPLLKAFQFDELNIGFTIVTRALFVGMTQAVAEMKASMARGICVEY